MDKNSRTAGATIILLVRLLTGVFIAGAGIAWICEPDMNDLFGVVQLVVGIALFCEAAYKNLFLPRDSGVSSKSCDRSA